MKQKKSKTLIGKIMGLLSVIGLKKTKETSVEAQANEYMKPKSPSEIAAGHPIVGAS